MFESNKYLDQYRKSVNYEHIEVTKEEFIDMFLKENDNNLGKAQFNAYCNTLFGGYTKIGEKMVKIKIEKEK